jgi:hypothetical protein
MSKLFKIKKWVTIREAAQHLSAICGEEINEAEVLRLGLDGCLKLSVYFVNHAKAKHGKIIPLEIAELWEPNPLNGGEPIKTTRGFLVQEGEVLELSKEIITIEGLWDLPMIGNERLDVEHEYQRQTGGPSVTLTCLDGTFIERTEGELYQLQEHFADNEYCKKENLKNPYGHRDNYYPAGGLPHDCVLVVRVGALTNLQERLSSDESSKEKPLGMRAETTYLNIIGGLLGLMLSKSPAGKPYSSFESQAAIILALLAHHDGKPGISPRTLEDKFAAAKRSLNAA